MRRSVRTRDGVRLAYYQFADAAPAALQPNLPVMFSHATGFHGRVFDSTIKTLGEGYTCYSMDHRGHGRSGWNPNRPLHWETFASDLLEVTHASCGTTPVLGVGHSMGAAALLMATLMEPQRFSGLVLYEPIIFPPEMRAIFRLMGDAPLATVARKRRSKFESHEEAILNFSRKAPMNSFDESVLRDYVMHGLVGAGTGSSAEDGEDGEEGYIADSSTTHRNGVKEITSLPQANSAVELRCIREVEAEVYNSAILHTTWSELRNIKVPTCILAGKYVFSHPSFFAERMSKKIPDSKFIRWEDAGHFGPFEKPERFADVISSMYHEVAGVQR